MAQSKKNSKTSRSTHAKSVQKARTASASPKKNKTGATNVTSRTTSDDLVADPSASELLDRTRMTTDQWYKSVKTTKSYANYVKSGKEWLEKWTKEGRQGLEEERETGEVPEERFLFAGAFDDIGAHTPTALRLLTAYKCDHLGRQFETAEGLRSAFKLYWERCVHCLNSHGYAL